MSRRLCEYYKVNEDGLRFCCGGDYCCKGWNYDPKKASLNADCYCPIKEKCMRPKNHYRAPYVKREDPAELARLAKIAKKKIKIPIPEGPPQNHNMEQYTCPPPTSSSADTTAS